MNPVPHLHNRNLQKQNQKNDSDCPFWHFLANFSPLHGFSEVPLQQLWPIHKIKPHAGGDLTGLKIICRNTDRGNLQAKIHTLGTFSYGFEVGFQCYQFPIGDNKTKQYEKSQTISFPEGLKDTPRSLPC